MRLKQSLLFSILENINSNNKYSKAYLNLKNVIELEKKEKDFKDQELIEDFEKITKNYNEFINGIPLVVVEKFYFENNARSDDYLYLEYNEQDFSLIAMEIFNRLELFFSEVFELACRIANFYNLEIKLGNNNSGSENKYL